MATEEFITVPGPRLVLTGPTGVGKTAYVDAIARAFPVEVINMDSCQAYAVFRVGTGRADGDGTVRRHLYGFLAPNEFLSVDRYLAKAVAVAQEVMLRGNIPLFEGGSRSLLPALVDALPGPVFGLRPPPDPAWILARMRRRAEGFLVDDALIREVEAGLAFGYGDSKLMRDPMIYMQTRDFLAGRYTREALISAMVSSMKQMHDHQLEVFGRMPIEWIDVASCGPAQLVERLAVRLAAPGSPT